ncbi:MAG: aminoacyl-histidine dipeptidase [Paludibacteraceae bacterium]|nr:aminoacyl-histidine dipeptidase [Paludibacteraceae bacterium]
MNKELFWKNFAALSAVPRPSHHTGAVAAFLLDFAKKRGFRAELLDGGSVLVQVPASPGMEDREPLILQGHIDMVPQVAPGKSHDFSKDPIETYISDGWMYARDTTLGADNGIAIAAMMTVMDDASVRHPALECLMTADEEVGMLGAFALKPGQLRGRTLLNLDTEDENELIVGCCGAMRATCKFRYVPEAVPDGDEAYCLTVKGLLGGHSGMDIHLPRANAIKLGAHLLKTLVRDYDARLASIDGGDVINTVPRELRICFTVPEGGEDDLFELMSDYQEIFENEYPDETDLYLQLEHCDLPASLLPEFVQDDLINALVAVPNGAYRFMPQMPQTVETSSNMGCISTADNCVSVEFLFRSMLYSMKGELRSMIESVFSLAGAEVRFWGDYEGWEPNWDSPVLAKARESYRAVMGRDARVCLVHAGLECGIIAGTYPDMDMISFGPNIQHPHTPQERVEVASVERILDLLEDLLLR